MQGIDVPLALIGILSNGEFCSNVELGKRLGMSQTDLRAHIQTLRNWGVELFPVGKTGYRLAEPMQLLDESIICRQISNNKVVVLPVISSTNQYLLDHIEELNSGDSCVAEYQQAGRGRYGRSWFSPFGVNLYLSMFWRFEQGLTSTTGLSLVIGIVIAEVLKKFGVDNVRVKWPNDLYLNDQKVGGVLIELSGKKEQAARIVIGTGTNIMMRNVQTDLLRPGEWIALRQAGFSLERNGLAAKLINELRTSLILFEEKGLQPFLSHWEKFDNFLNRPVKLTIGKKEIFGISHGVNGQGALMLEQNGTIRPWISGEISLSSAK